MPKTIGNSNTLRWRRRVSPFSILLIALLAANAFLMFRAGNNLVVPLDQQLLPPSFLDGFVEDNRRTLRSVNNVRNDGLVWITPKPRKARKIGYEDDWLMAWKEKHYNPDQATRCDYTEKYTPYNDELICTIPAYIPARYYVKPSHQPMIPRVIYVSRFDRRLGKALFISLMTLLHHNPTYEFIFFDDDDVDRFVCETSLRDEWAIPIFSRVRAGAMRADIWRLLILQRYGGVYLDSDISAIGPLPIAENDTAVSGVGCWSHLPGPINATVNEPKGLFEHWAMAFMPRHPYVTRSLEVVMNNLLHPEYLMRKDTMEALADESITERLSGPAMYQWALHSILNESKCEMVSHSFCDALWFPERYCKDMNTFRTYFPEGLRLYRRVNMNDTITHKIMYPNGYWIMETELILERVAMSSYYDVKISMITNSTDPTFCLTDAFEARARNRERMFQAL